MTVAPQINVTQNAGATRIGCRYFALIPAAGNGARMAGDVPKQYLPLLGKPLIWHALRSLAEVECIDHLFVILAPDDNGWRPEAFTEFSARLTILRCGGATRATSVGNGLAAIAKCVAGDCSRDWILVHDAARPCVTPAQISRLINTVAPSGNGGILAIPIADTLKRANGGANAQVATTVPRDLLWQAQTPQMFRHGDLVSALAHAPNVTDESGAIEAIGIHPWLVESDVSNLKVTYPQDLRMAELILRQRLGEST